MKNLQITNWAAQTPQEQRQQAIDLLKKAKEIEQNKATNQKSNTMKIELSNDFTVEVIKTKLGGMLTGLYAKGDEHPTSGRTFKEGTTNEQIKEYYEGKTSQYAAQQ